MNISEISAENAKTNGLYDTETGGQEMNRIKTLLWKPVISQYRQDRRLDFWRIVRDRCYEIDREYPQLTAEEGSYLAFWADKARKKDQRNDSEIDSILMRYGNQV